MVTFSALVSSGSVLEGMMISVDITGLPSPKSPKNSEKPGSSTVVPDDQLASTVVEAPSKSSSFNKTSGWQIKFAVGPSVPLGLPELALGDPVGDNISATPVEGTVVSLPNWFVGEGLGAAEGPAFGEDVFFVVGAGDT